MKNESVIVFHNTHFNILNYSMTMYYVYQLVLNKTHSLTHLLTGSNGVCEEVTRSTPQSPLRSVVRAHLPNKQRTTVPVQPGRTLKDALAKALNLRKLCPDVCIVYRKTNPKVSVEVRLGWVAADVIH